MVVFTLEAPIAAGKSTLLRLIQEAVGVDVVVVQEPVHEWQDVNGAGNLLDLFYTDTRRYAYTFETYLLVSRVTALEKAMRDHAHKPDTVFLMERSWESSRHVFGELTWSSGNLSPIEWELYKQTYQFVAGNAPIIDGHIFLDVSADVAQARMKKRCRTEESTVPKEYQEALIKQHATWLASTQVPILTVDGDQEFESDTARRTEVLQSIRSFVAQQRDVMQTPMRLPRTMKRQLEVDEKETPPAVGSPKRRYVPNPELDVATPSKLVRRTTA